MSGRSQRATVSQTFLRPTTANVTKAGSVLVVDDNQELRSLIAHFLRELGYPIIEADNGEQALKRATGARIQVLITDLVMPRMNGYELADRLIVRFPSLEVLYTSGHARDEVAQTRKLSAREAYLQKPFGLAELGKKLSEMIASGAPGNSEEESVQGWQGGATALTGNQERLDAGRH